MTILGLGSGNGPSLTGSANGNSGNEMYYFFYGTLQHPSQLRQVLGLLPAQPLPESRPARIRHYRTGLWGEYPALVRSDQFQELLERTYQDGDEPRMAPPNLSAQERWDRSMEFDVVPGHVVRLDPDKYERKLQEYETSNYSPQFVQVEILRCQPSPLKGPRRKRASTVRFDVPDEMVEEEEKDHKLEDESTAPSDGAVHQEDDDGFLCEWENDFAKTFVWVGDLSQLQIGRWSLVRWVEQQSAVRRGGLQFL